MTSGQDPFRHHPGLRDLVADPEKSFFRNVQVADVANMLQDRGLSTEWLRSDEEREAIRVESLAHRPPGDLWVFAYGSLIWDPAFIFNEIRRAHAPNHARRFILKDTGGARGDEENPGLMAALDDGDGCMGVALCIPEPIIERETEIIWRRECIGPAYIPSFVPIQTDLGDLTALTFVADHESDMMEPDLPHEMQVQYCATGQGFLGTSLEYVENLSRHFQELRIEDTHMQRLLDDARAYQRNNG